jgi:hypothetical protein
LKGIRPVIGTGPGFGEQAAVCGDYVCPGVAGEFILIQRFHPPPRFLGVSQGNEFPPYNINV